MSVAEAAVTKIVDRVPRAGMQAQLERAIQDLTQACMRFPGYLGITVLRPALVPWLTRLFRRWLASA